MSVVNQEELETIFDKFKAYYMEKWEQMEQTGNSRQWNWAAFLFNLFWLFYRRMYGYGFIALTIYLPLVIYRVYLRQPDTDFLTNDKIILIIMQLFFQLCFGFYGNYLYFQNIKRKLAVDEVVRPRQEAITTIKGADPFFAIIVYISFIVVSSYLAKSLGFSSQLGRTSSGGSNIWLESLTGEKEVVTGNGHNYFPEFSPDSKKVAFIHKGDKGWQNIVYHIVEKKVIYKQDLHGRPNRVSWLTSNDILYVYPQQGRPDIVRFNLISGEYEFLTNDAAEEVKPMISSDGHWILFFQSNQIGMDSGFDLYVMSMETREKIKIKSMNTALLNDISSFWDGDSSDLVVSNGKSLNTYDQNGKLIKSHVPTGLKKVKLMYQHPIEHDLYIFRARNRMSYSLYSLNKLSGDIKHLKQVDKLSNERISPDGRFLAYEQ